MGAAPPIPGGAQEAAGRVIHDLRDAVTRVAARHELPALPWAKPETPPPVQQQKQSNAKTGTPAAKAARGDSLLTPPEPPGPRPIESILQILARMPVLVPPPVEPPPPAASRSQSAEPPLPETSPAPAPVAP